MSKEVEEADPPTLSINTLYGTLSWWDDEPNLVYIMTSKTGWSHIPLTIPCLEDMLDKITKHKMENV